MARVNADLRHQIITTILLLRAPVVSGDLPGTPAQHWMLSREGFVEFDWAANTWTVTPAGRAEVGATPKPKKAVPKKSRKTGVLATPVDDAPKTRSSKELTEAIAAHVAAPLSKFKGWWF